MDASSVSSKGQVVIPKQFRDRLGLRAGARVRFQEEGGTLRLTVIQRRAEGVTVEEGRGLAGYSGRRIGEDEMRAAVRARARKNG